ncbi:MAG: tRNA (guanine-N(1)-)-methyltransferase, partial [Microgenomates group bacterium GW2011_GWA2_47_8]
ELGGVGMIIRVDVVEKAIENISSKGIKIALTPSGKVFNQKYAKELSIEKEITIISGRYEGFDERVYKLVDKKISIGEFITMGGEAPSLCIIEAIVRLIPGVLGNPESLTEESHSQEFATEYPQYTRPQTYQGMSVPKILLSGNHALMTKWRAEKALGRTRERRADLLRKNA